MSHSRFEELLPWSGAVAGLSWIGQGAFQRIYADDTAGGATTRFVQDHLALNYAAQGCLVLMGVALLFFATSVRNLLRSGEANEATYSSIAHAGWVVACAGIAQMVMWGWGLVNGASAAGDEQALHVLGYGGYFAWAGLGIGLATAFVATGLGGLRNAVLPRWFAILTVVLGGLGALGDAGIPPGGMVTYVLLPFWLITAAVIIARRQERVAEPPRTVLTGR